MVRRSLITGQVVKLTPPVVDITYYARSHGKAPRGFGTWLFSKLPPGTPGYLDHVFTYVGKYGDARRRAQSWFISQVRIYACD